jgi:2-amino-4-hydroxy-6-hydroxymethyldihydropteridine diphosphokinase
MIHCFISLGSNLNNPLQQVQTAAHSLAELPSTTLLNLSPWYQSAAIGPGVQQDYINGVAEIATTLEPLQLLSKLQAIENQQHRKRLERWGPRTLDLDLLMYGDQEINLPTLTVPHPCMLERNFVIYPLYDIAPDLRLLTGDYLKDQLKQHPMNDLHLVDKASYPTMAGQN